MIATEYQAQITRDWIARFEKALATSSPDTFQYDAYAGQIKDLKAELAQYEEGMKDGWLISTESGRPDSGSASRTGHEGESLPGQGSQPSDEPGES